MARDSENKFDFKVELEPDKDSVPSTSAGDQSKAVDDYIRDLDKVNESLSSVGSDLEKATSTGYNPQNMMNNTGAKQVQSSSSLPKKEGLSLDDGVKKDLSSAPSSTPEMQNPRETAPDVNKDYGSSLPPNNPNQPENPQASQPVEKNYGAPGTMPNQDLSDQEQEGGLPKKNDLEDAKEEKEEKDKQEGKDKQEENPEGNNSSDNNQEPKNENNNQAGAKSGEEKNPEAPNDLNKEKLDEQNAQTGNGYGALKRGATPPSDGEKNDRVRQNMDHSKRMQQGENPGNGNAKSSSGSINNPDSPSLGSRIKSRLKNILGGKADSKDDVSDNSNGRNKGAGSNPFNGAKDKIKSAIFNFLKANPHIAVLLAVIILFFLILMITNLTDEAYKGGNGTKCNYSLNGVLSTGSVELEGLQVELVNCDATSSNYTVLENVDFEKYVVGVALAEIGFSKDNPEYFKTGIIAARNFALTRNTSMCPSNPDNCFYGYNQSTGKIRMRACEADQVYWDYDKDIYRYDRGRISLYSPEINSGTVWKRALDEATKEEVLAIADEVKGKVLLDENGNVVHTDYINTDQQEWNRLASEGHTYDEILSIHYGGGSISGATCSSGNIDYGDYVLSSEGHTILHEPLDSFLEKQGTSLEAFNSLIAKNVQKAGYGTKAGVVAAAVTLIAELGNNYNVKVPYYWGGGHADGVVDGALGYWGSTQCHTYANNQSYNYCGLDCSGFVPWAIKNGGFNMAQMLAGNFQNLSGAQRVSLSNGPVIEPGDLLESSGHIVLVVGIEESSGSYICAEASGNAAGVLFTRRAFNSSGYWGIKMDGWYATHKRS